LNGAFPGGQHGSTDLPRMPMRTASVVTFFYSLG
jgi:hypothetical protein